MIHDHIAPGLFIEMINPAWARVHNELSFGRGVQDRLAWFSDSVRREFISLAGFDPAKGQYASLEYQHAHLNSARELECALYEADEHHELDGRDALDFAAGWMHYTDWMRGVDTSQIPSDEVLTQAATRGANSSGAVRTEAFTSGFISRAKMGYSFVA